MNIGTEIQKVQDILMDVAMALDKPEEAQLALKCAKAVRDVVRSAVLSGGPTKATAGRKPGRPARAADGAPRKRGRPAKVVADASAVPAPAAAATAPTATGSEHRHNFPTGAVGEQCTVAGCEVKKSNRGRKPKAADASAPAPTTSPKPTAEPAVNEANGHQMAAQDDGDPIDKEDWKPPTDLSHRTAGWTPSPSADADDDTNV